MMSTTEPQVWKSTLGRREIVQQLEVLFMAGLDHLPIGLRRHHQAVLHAQVIGGQQHVHFRPTSLRIISQTARLTSKTASKRARQASFRSAGEIDEPVLEPAQVLAAVDKGAGQVQHGRAIGVPRIQPAARARPASARGRTDRAWIVGDVPYGDLVPPAGKRTWS